MRLLFGTGSDIGDGEIKCLAAETGVLARRGWGTFGTPMLELEYMESTLFWLNTLLADLIAEKAGKSSLTSIGGGTGDRAIRFGIRRRLIEGGAAEIIGGGGAGGSTIGCSNSSGRGEFSICFKSRWSWNEKTGARAACDSSFGFSIKMSSNRYRKSRPYSCRSLTQKNYSSLVKLFMYKLIVPFGPGSE